MKRFVGLVACPASKLRHSCSNPVCRTGTACRELHALGLTGRRTPLPHKERPTCGARKAVRVVPGKRRCRFHGGLSTGPRTVEGRARIAEAQRRRWKALRAANAKSWPLDAA